MAQDTQPSMEISAHDFRKMEVSSFVLLLKAYKANSEHMLTKMETLKAVAEVLHVDKTIAFTLMSLIQTQSRLDAMSLQHQTRDPQQYSVADQPVYEFDAIFDDSYQYSPSSSRVKVKEERVIMQPGYQDLDYSLFQQLTKVKENAMARLAKFLRTKTGHSVAQALNLRKQLIDQALRGIKSANQANNAASTSEESSSEYNYSE